MKKIFIILLLLLATTTTFSQKKKKPKTPPKKAKNYSNSNQIDSAAIAAYPTEASRVTDTLKIAAGKPYLFLVNVQQQDIQSTDDCTEKEQKEIKNNFPDKNIEIKIIKEHVFILFDNGQTLDISEYNNAFEAKAFWGGKTKDSVQVDEKVYKSTEFVAKQLGLKKESSYVINKRKYVAEVEKLLSKNKPTEKSKAVMMAYLKDFFEPLPDIDYSLLDLFKSDVSKLKKLDVYITEKKGKKEKYRTVTFSEQKLPINLTMYREGKVSYETKLYYENDLLVKRISGENEFLYTYQNDKIICNAKGEDIQETNVYYIENNKLHTKSYSLYLKEDFASTNTYFFETKNENNCEMRLFNNELIRKNCYTDAGVFPFIHKYTSYQNGEFMQFQMQKVEKIDDKTFKIYRNSAEKEEEPIKYELAGTFLLNQYNLPTVFDLNRNKENRVIKIDYEFYK